MMADKDSDKSSKKVEEKEDHPGDLKPKESADAKPKDDKEIQLESNPVCTSANHPDCLTGTAADPNLEHDLRNPLDNDIKMNHLRLTNEGYAQVKSIPACNSSSRPKCIKEAKTAADESIAENMRHPSILLMSDIQTKILDTPRLNQFQRATLQQDQNA
jgi:hypothetical protein